MTRELFYTALTRARKKFTMIGNIAEAVKAVGHQTERDSGLGNKIWKGKIKQ